MRGKPAEQRAGADESAVDAVTLSRRDFLTAAGLAAAGVLSGCSPKAREEFLRKHFLELSPAEVEVRLANLRDDYEKRFGREVSISALPAQAGVMFGYALDLSRCIGCRRCVYACVKENNQSRHPQIQWIRVLEMEKEKGIDLEGANPYYNPERVPDPDHFYVPVACQQCRNPQCTKVCPVGATWQEPDGIVVIDYDWCIGCRCCMAACPYGARHFNWGEPELPPDELNTNMHILGNRPRPRGVVEKCTFCIQRTRAGRYPACVEICPVGARKFGNLLDPESEIARILHEKRVFVLKSELKTEPKFYYFYGV
jgi:Fe-S-cluster-containing dehydrogenase component